MQGTTPTQAPLHTPAAPIALAAVLVKNTPAGPGALSYTDELRLRREGLPGTMSGVDLFAVAAARSLGAEVVAITMGPQDARGALREALCLGADRAVHISDQGLANADAVTTARVLAKAVELLGVGAVFTGRESSDGRMGVIGAMVAEVLGWPLVSGADRIRSENGKMTARVRERATELLVSATLPVVCSVAEYGAEPRPIDRSSLQRAFRTPIEVWGLDRLGLQAPPPQQTVCSVQTATHARAREIIHDNHLEVLLTEFARAKELSA